MMVIDFLKNIAYFIRALKHIENKNRVVCDESHRGGICILGNGPSLTKVLPAIIASRDIAFVMNDFAISDYYPMLKPYYYIIVDPYYWEDITIDVEIREKVMNSLNGKTTWRMVLFVPDYVVSKHLLDKMIHNVNIEIKAFNYTNFHPTYTDFYRFILKNNLGVVPVGNVLGQAIYLSINLGYDNIKIYGAEHSWTQDIIVNDNNEVCTIKRHFYANSDEVTLVPWKKSNGQIFKMYEILTSLRNHFWGYQYLEWYSRTLNRKIINCTAGSFIDAFDRDISHKNEA